MSPSNQKVSNNNNAIYTAVLYGVINTIMVTPISISFCSIIFRDAAFEAYMPKLVKLVLISCAIHQLCFTLFSSLPFAIGQVQDAGLIFLSAMAADIAHRATDPEHIVPTTLYLLGICTAILGVMLVVVSKLKLASMVQYLPMPVIGGYLAFIGFFCGEAGLAMMAGVRVASITEWGNFLHYKPILLLTPGVACGITTYFLLRKFRSPLILPLSLITIFVVFYAVMWGGGFTLEDAREYGWIAPLTPTGSTFEAWKLYDITLVEWWHFPRQIFTLIAMFFVVAFSSSLDVAAIEMELGVPLDYNKELNTVGISNLISGLFGGYTGSYIFSQTIFTMRRGVTSRVCGYCIIFGEVVIALLPICITAYIPKMFFGSLLVLIATDLMFEWLVEARAKMMLSEYLVCLLTFVAIQLYGIEIGMLIGILGAMTSFVITYSKLQSVSGVTLKSSTVIRSYEERAVLLATRGKVLTISMGGYIFFGSAVKILEEIKSKLESDSGVGSSGNSERVAPPLSSPSLQTPYDTNGFQFSQTTNPTDEDTDDDLPYVASTKGEKITSKNNAQQQQLPSTPSRYNMWMRTPKSQRKTTSLGSNSLDANSCSPLKDSDKRWGDEKAPLLTRAHSTKGAYGGIPIPHTPHPAVQLIHQQQQQQQQQQQHPYHQQQPLKFVYSASPTQSHIQNHLKSIYELSAEEIKVQHDHYIQSLQQSSPGRGGAALMGMGPRGGVMSGSSSGSNVAALATSIDRATRAIDLESGPWAGSNDRLDNNPQDNWIIGEDDLKGSNHSLSNSMHSIPVNINNNNINNSTTTTAVSATSSQPVLHSPSLLNLVWEGQAQRRERMRSMSDMGLDASVHSTSYRTSSLLQQATAGPNLSSSNGNLPMQREGSFAVSQLTRDLARPALPTTINNPVPVQATITPPEYIPVLPKLHEPSSVLIPPAESNVEGEQIIEYLVLDFAHVIGVDATAARSCFLSLVHLMKNADVIVVFANMTHSVEELLKAHHVIDSESVCIPVLDDALEWCEDQMLTRYRTGPGGLLPKSSHLLELTHNRGHHQQKEHYVEASKHRQSLSSPTTISNIIRSPATVPQRTSSSSDSITIAAMMNPLCTILEDYLEIVHDKHHDQIASLLHPTILMHYFHKEVFQKHQIIFDLHESADKVYFIEFGQVEIVSVSQYQDTEDNTWFPSPPPQHQQQVLSSPKGTQHRIPSRPLHAASPATSSTDTMHSKPAVVRINKVSSGGVFGEADFFLGRNHSVRAYTVTDSVIVWTLNKQQFIAMEISHPQLCMLIQYTLLKSLSIASTCAMYALHPTTAHAAHDI